MRHFLIAVMVLAMTVVAHAAPAPAGFIGFCTRFPDQCQPTKDGSPVITVTAAQWVLLKEVNQAVNRAIKPMGDLRHYGKAEYWTIPTDGFGDCEDYALTKRRDLIAAGFPAQALRMTVTNYEDGHAVLTIVTTDGDFVMDNLNDDIKPVAETGYQIIERQSADVWNWEAQQ